MEVVDGDVFLLSRKNIQLLDNMLHTQGRTTEKDQLIYSTLMFYLSTKKLERMGLIECNGRISCDSNLIEWLITPKGRDVVKFVQKLDAVLRE